MLFLWRLLGFRRLLLLFVLRRAWRIVQRRRATANAADRPRLYVV
jgi:hypothetical protein